MFVQNDACFSWTTEASTSNTAQVMVLNRKPTV